MGLGETVGGGLRKRVDEGVMGEVGRDGLEEEGVSDG